MNDDGLIIVSLLNGGKGKAESTGLDPAPERQSNAPTDRAVVGKCLPILAHTNTPDRNPWNDALHVPVQGLGIDEE